MPFGARTLPLPLKLSFFFLLALYMGRCSPDTFHLRSLRMRPLWRWAEKRYDERCCLSWWHSLRVWFRLCLELSPSLPELTVTWANGLLFLPQSGWAGLPAAPQGRVLNEKLASRTGDGKWPWNIELTESSPGGDPSLFGYTWPFLSCIMKQLTKLFLRVGVYQCCRIRELNKVCELIFCHF